jgi:ABC-2 type transport system ATP-binding protein
MKVREYLNFIYDLKKVKFPKKEHVQEVMKLVKIDDVQNRSIKNLSKGYKQRVGLAQAILGDPEVIILDEPSVGLDPMQIIEIRELIKKLGEKHTVILSSHILSEVSAVCDQIMIIAHGKLVANDTLEGLQKLFASHRTLTISVKGDAESVKAIAASMPGVLSTEAEVDQESGYVKVLISLDEKADIREELSLALAEKKMPVMSMVLEEKNLEDIFIELTGSDDDLAVKKTKRGDR